MNFLKAFVSWRAKLGSVNGFLGQTMPIWHLIIQSENKMGGLSTLVKGTHRNMGKCRITWTVKAFGEIDKMQGLKIHPQSK